MQFGSRPPAQRLSLEQVFQIIAGGTDCSSLRVIIIAGFFSLEKIVRPGCQPAVTDTVKFQEPSSLWEILSRRAVRIASSP